MHLFKADPDPITEAIKALDLATLQIIGDTPTGRATIVGLELNRLGVVNLRRLLGEEEGHPPSHTL
jgi:hypothetical protein